MGLLVATMVVAAVLGFSLASYFFFYRVHLTAPWRWLGAVVGGLIIAVLLSMTSFMVLWPPVDLATTILGVMTAAVVIGAALYGGSSNGQKEVKSGDDLDDYRLDIGSGTGS